MKKYTRFLAFLLAFAMLLSCSTSAFAENAGSAEDYYQFIDEYLDAQREAATSSPDPVLSESIQITKPFTEPADLKKPATGRAAEPYALMTMGLDDDDYGVAPAAETTEDPVISSKVTTANDDGTYTVRIEAFAIGETQIEEQEKVLPTDIILVLDQSGSMDDDFTTYIEGSFQPYGVSKTNGEYWDIFLDTQDIWYQLESGEYVQIQVERTAASYSPEKIDQPDIDGYAYSEKFSYRELLFNYADNGELLYYDEATGTYRQVSYSGESKNMVKDPQGGTWDYIFASTIYTFKDKETGAQIEQIAVGNLGGYLVNQIPYEQFYVKKVSDYTYRYYYNLTGESNNNVYVDTVQGKGADTPINEETDFRFYYRILPTTSTVKKMEALQNSVRAFVESVAGKGDEGHRIAVVGFASGNAWQGTNYYYENTEVFVGGDQHNYSTVMADNFNPEDAAEYSNYKPLRSMPTEQGDIEASIEALEAEGGTLINHGMELAEHIFGLPLYEDDYGTDRQGNPTRNKVVIVFTDGQPGWSGYDDDVAEEAKEVSNRLKNNGATVYTVGVFNGADVNGDDDTNRFMRELASSGTGYYLVASDADELSTIFKRIANKIETGYSYTTLDETAVVKDVVSEFFVPVGGDEAEITLKTANYAGRNADGERIWVNEAVATGVTAEVKGDTVSVTGFDFSNQGIYVSDANDGTPTGKKLIIEFKIKPKDGFIGGNNVPTNGDKSGIYDSVGNRHEEFDVPHVNVPITDQESVIEFTLTDKNVYLLGGVSAQELYPVGSVVIHCANGTDIELDPTAENYGLEAWQYAYANVSIELSHPSGMTGLTADTTFSLNLAIDATQAASSDSDGALAEDQGPFTENAQVNVFKPELTFDDSEVDYKSTVANPDYYNASNYEGVVWKHGDTVAPESMGSAPALNLTYTASSDDIDAQNVVVAQKDIPVKVTVTQGGQNVTGDTTFRHTACGTGAECTFAGCTWSETTLDGDPAFLLHVVNIYGQLEITKTVSGTPAEGAATDFSFKVELSDSGTFNYTKSNGAIGAITSGGTITLSDGQTVTIFELPPDTAYTVTETVPAGYVADKSSVTGAIQAGATVTAAFTNTYTTGQLTVSKQVVGTNPPANEEFAFTVQITPAVSGSIGGLEFQNGTASFKLKNGESKTITGLPINADYTVTETANNAYTTTVNGVDSYEAQGKIDADGETVAYTNTYKTGCLTINKDFAAGVTPEDGETFLFKVKSGNNVIAEVVIKGKGSATIKDLPYGDYTVEEDAGWSWRYTPDGADSQSVTVDSDSETVTFTNKVKTDKWLDANAYAENKWTNGSVALDKTTAVNATDGKNN